MYNIYEWLHEAYYCPRREDFQLGYCPTEARIAAAMENLAGSAACSLDWQDALNTLQYEWECKALAAGVQLGLRLAIGLRFTGEQPPFTP